MLLRELCTFSRDVRQLLNLFEEFPSYEHSISYRDFAEELQVGSNFALNFVWFTHTVTSIGHPFLLGFKTD